MISLCPKSCIDGDLKIITNYMLFKNKFYYNVNNGYIEFIYKNNILMINCGSMINNPICFLRVPVFSPIHKFFNLKKEFHARETEAFCNLYSLCKKFYPNGGLTGFDIEKDDIIIDQQGFVDFIGKDIINEINNSLLFL